MSNSLGEAFRITVFGESHGPAIGVVIDGCPAGLALSLEEIQKAVDRRKPVSGAGQTARREADAVEILAGVFNGRTTGAALALQVRNRDTDSAAYAGMRFTPRPGHADFTAWTKYGGFNDYRGGGTFSGRVTVALVMAGAVAAKLLATLGMEVLAHTVGIGSVQARPEESAISAENIDRHPLRCVDPAAADAMQQTVESAMKNGDSLGGLVEGLVRVMPAGLGEPYFDSLEGQLSKALFAVPAIKGVEFGLGFEAARRPGSQVNDPFRMENGRVVTETNHAGGILGGISSGSPLRFRVAVKPTPSIAQQQPSVNLQTGRNEDLTVSGRHDSCIVPRAAVVVEAVTAVVLCDFALRAGILKRILK